MRLRPSRCKRKDSVKKKMKITDEYEVCDATVYESMRLRPSTRRRESNVFRIIHFGKRFRMYEFRTRSLAT